MDSLKLKNGAELPAVGLGFWKVDNDRAADLVCESIKVGYRHFDCACDYGNEAEVGKGLQRAVKDGLCQRDDLWITSKLWNTYHAPEHVRTACEKSLSDLRLDVLDLYLVHFPIAQTYVPIETRYPPGWFFDPDADDPKIHEAHVPIIETWQAMEELVTAGLVKNVGVCNFGVSLLRDLRNSATSPPSVLQVELHPYLAQEKLLRYCQEEGIVVTGFSPLGAQSYFALDMANSGESVIEQESIKQIAGAHSRTPAQIVLRWGVQRGTSIVPKTSNFDRLRENLALFDFELTDAEMHTINKLDQHRRFNDPGDFAESAFNTFFPIYE